MGSSDKLRPPDLPSTGYSTLIFGPVASTHEGSDWPVGNCHSAFSFHPIRVLGTGGQYGSCFSSLNVENPSGMFLLTSKLLMGDTVHNIPCFYPTVSSCSLKKFCKVDWQSHPSEAPVPVGICISISQVLAQYPHPTTCMQGLRGTNKC